jgi:LmbE family N-acetylglucosaminyl deacetylase
MVDRVVGISPHLDDLVLSCGSFLSGCPGSLMVTAFANGPSSVDPLPGWDQASGFRPGVDVAGVRKLEDARASRSLGSSSRHLDYWDMQYREATYAYAGPVERDDLARAVAAELEALIAQVDERTWLIPLGLVHPDHLATSDACLLVAANHPEIDWLVFNDLPYAADIDFPGDVERAESELLAKGFELHGPITMPPPDDATKQAAIKCYESQLAPLEHRISLSIVTPEVIRPLVYVR